MEEETQIPSLLEVVLTSTGKALIGESSYNTGHVLMMRNAVLVPRKEVEDNPAFLTVDRGMVYDAYLSRRDEISDVGLHECLVRKHHREVYRPLGL